mmetsp:Transcript_15017/g.26588  ORF Transcript_15017/g.26588 Transcript_15017/m.26588 type:complete len:107 (-) Transcript_15017:71-391(-)
MTMSMSKSMNMKIKLKLPFRISVSISTPILVPSIASEVTLLLTLLYRPVAKNKLFLHRLSPLPLTLSYPPPILNGQLLNPDPKEGVAMTWWRSRCVPYGFRNCPKH